MKTLKSILLLTLSIVTAQFLVSCGTAQKVKEATTAVEAAQEYAKGVQEGTSKAAERRAKGDTLAIPYADLQKFLPASVAGFDKDGDPSGQTMNMAGVSYSVAEQRYKKGDGSIKISIADYNAAYAVFAGVAAVANSGFSMENDEEKSGGVDLGVAGIKAFQSIKKKSKDASLVAAISDRFFVSVEGNNIDNPDVLKDAVKSIDLKSLSAK